MNTELQIVWRDVEPSAALEGRIREHFDGLERATQRATACRVTVELPHRHQHHGRHYQVKIELKGPGGAVVVSRDPTEHQTSEDAFAAVNEAFAKLDRRLERREARRRVIARHAGRQPRT